LSLLYAECDFYFCVGADSFIDLVNGKWQQADRILNDLLFNRDLDTDTSGRCPSNRYRRRIVVLYRSQTKIISENNALTETASNIIPDSSPSEYYDKLQKLVEELGVKLIRMDRAEDNISSTFVRNCSDVSKLLDNPAVILTEVVQYIQQHQLYQFCK
jgi:nicotinic acid mononucleotide adenylyltransferase